MINVIKDWFHKYFSHPEAVLLVVLISAGLALIIFWGAILTPVLASIIIAYLLQSWVVALIKRGLGHFPAYLTVYIGFLALFIMGILILFPLVWRQMISLFNDLPLLLQKSQELIFGLLEEHPSYFSEQQLDTLVAGVIQDVQNWGKVVLSASLSSIPGVITWIVYLILVPLLVFFFLKDHGRIIVWFRGFLPKKHPVLSLVWSDMDEQIGNYVRGKITEIVIVGFCTYLVFLLFGLRYSILLATLVGFSVVIPYVGAAVVTIPVFLVGYFQWGWSADFTYMFIAYLVIQALDGNLLVPLLFSEAVNLHPVAIIVSILVFGGVWGFWGVFFAIPLATLVKSILDVWPTASKYEPT